MPFGEIVIHGDLMPRVEQFLNADGPDVTRAAGDKNVEPADRPVRQQAAMRGQGRNAKAGDHDPDRHRPAPTQ